uniref:Ycf1 n=1 Tax=Caulerpa lentillifera TaxID=148947 RepID=A0A345HGZ0_9CHLO|nr:Ycf1 [Caulerpa lentillifera]AXG75880.1 Ycf1 [Caulerpa lentillifera]
MSIIIPGGEIIKNTIEVLNQIYELPRWSDQFVTFFKYFWNYLSTLKWIDYYAHFGLILPKNTNSIFTDFINLQTPNLSLLAENQVAFPTFFNGFFNCFFLYFPFSPVHFLWLRSVIIQGAGAGSLASSFGFILGHLSLLGCCLFGFREIIYIWFGFEPLSYFLGLWLIFVVVFQIIQKGAPLQIIKKSQKKQLVQIFFINFALVWTDQSSLFPFFGNLCFHSGMNSLDVDYNSTFYFLGIFFGSFFWIFLFSSFFRLLGYFLTRFTQFKFSSWIKGFHHFCLIGCLTLSFTSFVYYGVDYLFTNPLGFVSQDSALKSIFKIGTPDAPKGRLGRFGEKSMSSIETDLSLFDRGRYASGPSVEFNFESLNYQEEYMWRTRLDRLSSRGGSRGKGGMLNKFLVAKLGPAEEARQNERRRKKQAQQLRKFQQIQQQALSQKTSSKFEYTFQSEPEIYGTEDEDQDLDYHKEISETEEEYPGTTEEEEEEFIGYYKKLIERFIYDYTGEANKQDPDIPDLPNDKMIHFSSFSEIMKYGFDIFSSFSTDIDENPNPLEYEIKERYSESFIYRFLVNFDISNFLQGLPKNHQMTSQEEIELFKKRFALSQYLDTLRNYSKLNMENIGEIFQPLFCGPKSFSNRIYNQQFKGTLKIVERLFSIHLEDEQNIPNVESEEGESSDSEKEDYKDLYLKIKKEPSVLKFDQPLYNSSNFPEENPLSHRLITERQFKKDPFIKETNPIPFFVAWNREKRKFVITNRLLTRRKTLDELRISREIEPFFKKFNLKKTKRLKSSIKRKKRTWNRKLKKFDTEYKRKSKVTEVIRPLFFNTWPVNKKTLEENPLFTRLYRVPENMETQNLFVYMEPLMEEEDIIYEKLPNIIERINLNYQTKLSTSLSPKRGGFIWPGNQPLQFNFIDDIQGYLENWVNSVN